jgi:large subunit ribosomal protein L10
MLEGREVKPSKIKAVEDLAELIKKYRVLGIINLRKTPAAALQKIKSSLKDKMLVKVAKKSTIVFALDKVGKNNLKDYVNVSPALILTNEDPFKIYLALERNKTLIFAKSGDKAPEDIVIKEGPTDLPPGPAISTLTKVKLPAKVVGGTISILRDKVICKAGEEIDLDVASALQLLKLKTLRVGLDVVVMEEGGKVYTKDQLYIDVERLMSDIRIASMNALNLSLNIEYPTKENIKLMVIMAHLNAKALEKVIGSEKEESKEDDLKQEESPESREGEKKE